MINRIYLNNCLSFKEVELNFNKGLNIFTGPSGAGKSIFMEAMLSIFSLANVKSNIAEVNLSNMNIQEESYGIEVGDDIVIKAIKKENLRYFLNNQSISRKKLKEFSSRLIKHLNLKDTSDFKNDKLLNFLDRLLYDNKSFNELKANFEFQYKQLVQQKNRLEKIEDDELKIEELKEFTKFEIEKIEKIDPKIDEYEELARIKDKLSKKEKVTQAIEKASPIMNYTAYVNEVLELLDVNSGFFDDSINELNNIFESYSDSLEELEEVDIEYILDRIEKLSFLQKKFGSISEALEYKNKKQKELQEYENISFEKESLIKTISSLEDSIYDLSSQMTIYRKKASKKLENTMNKYLKELYLNELTIDIDKKELSVTGVDFVELKLKDVSLDSISSGEFNRLRLALLTSMSQFDIVDNGILFLDEIDANLSGKESDAIAKVLTKLANSYQIFAISHQPQLTSSANQHFLVDKKESISTIKSLSYEQKVEEISRMISGKDITQEAVEFAKNLLEQ
ncbi:MAG: AAA family ATPase [Campylobacterota bacterium]